jgi:hypothetical protein
MFMAVFDINFFALNVFLEQISGDGGALDVARQSCTKSQRGASQ